MRAYFRMIGGIDHVVGRLVAQLEEQGLADNTVIIYTADNGYYLGDRGFAGKWTHYEQSLRVPLIVHDPRLPEAERGHVLSELALNSDLASTMISLAGLPVPDAHTGRSLAPLIEGKAVADWRKDFPLRIPCRSRHHSPLGRRSRYRLGLRPLLCERCGQAAIRVSPRPEKTTPINSPTSR